MTFKTKTDALRAAAKLATSLNRVLSRSECDIRDSFHAGSARDVGFDDEYAETDANWYVYLGMPYGPQNPEPTIVAISTWE